jgi:hypothetical protein
MKLLVRKKYVLVPKIASIIEINTEYMRDKRSLIDII